MKKHHNNSKIIILLLSIILLDQITKLAVYKYMDYGSEGHINIIGKFFGLTYILNPGMAFGLQFNMPYGKIVLVAIRIFLSIFIANTLFNKNSKTSRLEQVTLTLMLGGAIGNTIDCIFYGKFLNNAPINSPFDWFYGQVIDMLDLHVFSGYLPKWMPIWGGNYISLFPVGNIADVAVLISFALLFYLYCIKGEEKTDKGSDSAK